MRSTEGLKVRTRDRRQRKIVELFGTIEFDATHDAKAQTAPTVSVLVDTMVWSEAPRRRVTRPASTTRERSALIDKDRVVVIGAVRQELLSGLRTAEPFTSLRDRLRAFPDVDLDNVDYENAASCLNECQSQPVRSRVVSTRAP